MRYLVLICCFLLCPFQADAWILVGSGGVGEPGLLLHWTGMGTGAETLLKTSEATTITNTGSGVTFDANGANYDAVTDDVTLTATDGSNFNKAEGTISFEFMGRAGVAYASFVSLYGMNGIRIEQFNTSTSQFSGRAGGQQFITTAFSENIYDGSWHTLSFSWSDSGNVMKIKIDATTKTRSLPVDASVTSGISVVTVGNLNATRSLAPTGAIRNVKVYNSDIL